MLRQLLALRVFLTAATASLLLVTVTGCGKSELAAESKPASDPLIDELFEDIARNAPESSEQRVIQPVSHEVRGKSTVPRESGVLTLNVSPGDRFSLVRSVSQTLRQKVVPQAILAVNDLQLSFELLVGQVTKDQISMSVIYRRVVYGHNIEGQLLNWDSASGNAAPAAVASYAAMLNNGFTIILGRDNRVKGVEDYNQFIDRCVDAAPDGLKEHVRGRMSQSSPAADVADLVDTTIGLLPFHRAGTGDVKIAVGDQWTREQSVGGGGARVRTSCSLKDLSPLTAEIVIRTRVSPAENQDAASSVRITGGSGTGTCLIDCQTGLPITSERTQSLSLVVPTANGMLAEQEKLIRTTVRSRFEPAVLTN